MVDLKTSIWFATSSHQLVRPLPFINQSIRSLRHHSATFQKAGIHLINDLTVISIISYGDSATIAENGTLNLINAGMVLEEELD
jgi:hypothetical protein